MKKSFKNSLKSAKISRDSSLLKISSHKHSRKLGEQFFILNQFSPFKSNDFKVKNRPIGSSCTALCEQEVLICDDEVFNSIALHEMLKDLQIKSAYFSSG